MVIGIIALLVAIMAPSLTNIHCPEVDVKGLTAAMSDGREDPIVRAGAAKGLAGRRDTTSIPRLVDALEDPDSRVRGIPSTPSGGVLGIPWRRLSPEPCQEFGQFGLARATAEAHNYPRGTSVY